MKSESMLFLIFISVLLVSCVTQGEVVYYAAPTDPPGISPDMKTAGFWISRLENRDDLILTVSEIDLLNRQLSEKFHWNLDFSQPVPDVSSDRIREDIQSDIDWLSGDPLYFSDGKRVPASYFEEMQNLMALDELPETIEPRYALVTQYADQRVLPSSVFITEVPRELFFDYNQMSALDPGTPLAVIAESSDGEWVYAYSPRSGGWIQKEKMGFCGYEDLNAYIQGPRLVVTAAKASLYAAEDFSEYYGFARMGSQFPLISEQSELYETRFPFRNEEGRLVLINGYIEKEAASNGFLPYTARTIITQAFKLLHYPYGWGGMFGEQDCSRFTIEVFASVGVVLPRNSSWQGNNLKLLAEFEKTPEYSEKQELVAEQAVPGSTLFRMVSPGHVALYLGEYQGEPYIIHETWGYLEKTADGERERMTNRVVVTPMTLGEGTSSGAYWERLVKVVRVILLEDSNP